ncbi:nitrate- and nitrite sensing domain-containing protein [Streptomyces sp. NBC_01205]|uniref:nitrate- and nitrite sensing domain-containing protein n=1 Tax=Streptomyces sp. NBC_01205 TaxID=2903771 RepID=UPI002E12B920|nr:nitrate- and nitrite sensing domain-containing protein [Streptomyces sp. NBC_01205]
MQKKRSRKNGTAIDGPAPAGRSVRVRSRLVLGVAVAGLTVLAAGAPAVVSATRELNDSQQLVTLAEQTQHTLTLAHLLGDERDAVVEYVAKGRPGAQAKAPVQERTALTDRQLAEVQSEADEPLARALARVQAVRNEAVDGKGGALAAQQAYTGVIAELLAPGDRLAELTPPRAVAALATTRPLAPLGQAVEQASATRGLLLAALAVPRGEQPSNTAAVDELSTAAQRARVREQAALDDFSRVSRPDVRQTLAATVTGPEVKAADDYLKRLTERPTLSTADRKLDGATVAPALTARIDRMRSVESTLAGQRATALASLRDDDVTRLEMLVAVLGLLFLVAIGFSTAVARSLTRPLSVLRRGAARLATPEGSVEPVRFTGRNDEFAEVVRHLNAVRDQTVALHTRIAGLDADGRRLIGRNEALTAGREALEQELKQLRAGLEEHRRVMSTTSVSLSLRTLGLVERQLAVIEELESREQDPDRLATLFKMDHLATVMRRHNENLLVLAGQEHGHGAGAVPVPLVDVMRAAVSEIERYERVDLTTLPPFTQVAGHAADDISHVLAELLENATTFSPPEAKVKVSGWLLDSGDAVLSVVDEGIGVTGDRLEALNARLATPESYDEEPEAEHGLGLGLYVAGRLAARHGVTAELRAGRPGGTEALVVVPAALLPATPPTSPVHTFATPGMPEFRLPGVIAEANENTIPPRRMPPAADRDAEPLAQAEPAPEPFRDPGPEADAELLRAMEWDPAVPPAAVPPAADETTAAESAAGDPATEEPAAEPVTPDAQTRSGEPEPGEAEVEAAAETSDLGAELAGEFGPDLAGGLEPDSDTDAHAPAADGGLPPADQVFTAQASEPAPEPAAGGHAFADQEAALPPADQVFTAVSGPAEELLARVVPDAPISEPEPEVPGADQVFTAAGPTEEVPGDRDPGDELLARVVPDAGPEGFAGADPDPASPEPLTGAGPRADVPEERPSLPGRPVPAAAPDGPAEPHRHAPDEADWIPRQGSHPDAGPERVTGKGLPKRTPRTVAAGRPGRTDAVRPEPPRRVDADELRRRLGGFYQGTRDGRRVVAAELAQDTDQGDTAQEART